MKRLLLVLIGLSITLNAFGTAQIPDKIIYKGRTYMLNSNPMESYFEKYPDKRPSGQIMSTGLWRGYVATFEVVDNQLFLRDIEVKISTTDVSTGKTSYGWESKLSQVVPDTTQMMKVDWFTGLLVIPRGKLKNYVHMGYGSSYSKYIVLEFLNGNYVKEKKFNHKQYERFKERQFEAFKQTDEYIKLRDELMIMNDEEMSDEFIDSFLRAFVIEYTSKILVD